MLPLGNMSQPASKFPGKEAWPAGQLLARPAGPTSGLQVSVPGTRWRRRPNGPEGCNLGSSECRWPQAILQRLTSGMQAADRRLVSAVSEDAASGGERINLAMTGTVSQGPVWPEGPNNDNFNCESSIVKPSPSTCSSTSLYY